MENGDSGKLAWHSSHQSVPVEAESLASSCSAKREHGFTIVELMIVVLIAAVLAGIAVPSFEAVIKRNRIESIQSQFSAALAAARTAATSRNQIVVVCASDGANSCREDVVGDWSNGWIVFIDSSTPLDNKRDANEQILESFNNSMNLSIKGISGVGAGQGPASYISYGSRGFLKGVQPTLLVVCGPDNDANFARGMFVTAAGNIMKTRDGSDANSIHQNPLQASTDLACN